jgi:OOP family OmpA-OmpF porin
MLFFVILFKKLTRGVKMKKVLSLSLVSLLLANTATYAATEGGYAGLGLGYSKQNTHNSELQNLGVKEKIGGLGGRIFAGYNFNNYFGIESGIAQYADSTDKYQDIIKTTYKTRALDVVGKAYLPIADSGFNVYALGGAAVVNTKFNAKIRTEEYTATSAYTTTKIRPIVGVGASYDIPQTPITTNFEFSHIVGKGDASLGETGSIPDSNLFTLNIAYKFGQ